MVNLIAIIKLKPGKEALFAQKMVEYSRFVQVNDCGCIQYAPHIDVKNPSNVVLFEKWADQASLDAHLNSPQMKEARKMFAECTEGPAQLQFLKEMK